MNWIDNSERRYGNLRTYLINGLMIGQLAAGLIVLLFDWKFASMISAQPHFGAAGADLASCHIFVSAHLAGRWCLGVLNLVFYFWIGKTR